MTGPPSRRPCSRRALLRTGALAVLGLGGCVDDPAGDATTTPGSTTPAGTTGTDEPTGGETGGDGTATGTTPESFAFEIVPKTVRTSFLYNTSPDSMDVATVDGVQFLFVVVQPTSDEPSFARWPAPENFALVTGDDRIEATTTPGSVHDPLSIDGLGNVYAPDRGRGGWLAFEVPDPFDGEEAIVTSGDREQSLPDEFLADLRTPPADFELVSFDAPERVSPDERFDVTCTVENVGEGDGTFRTCLNQSGPMYIPHPVEFEIPAGERRE